MTTSKRKIFITRYLEETITVEVDFDAANDEDNQLIEAEAKIAENAPVANWSVVAPHIESTWVGEAYLATTKTVLDIPTAEKLIAKHGYWAELSDYSLEDWKQHIANDDTRQSYWQWVAALLDEAAEEKENLSKTL